ncbi:acyl-CoA dehydrogenase [Iamia sp. SCSIO 61187]|uniref:acyl-CoA dehydrogenase family protein n=1 Tax=Iamia sp. SCSIO 61187 TaxID=2722752 RepID=UPI001C62945A|nr:acyl-CoA dehydrogenase family protein [Iamia sp. SCSIO 61187]QYG92568.1 acyl-CoA dehydrogenase [Iamia sp. SCSIO 61187]
MTELDRFRADAAAFIASSVADGLACRAFGAILPPDLHDRARGWQRYMAEHGFAALHWPEDCGGRGLSRAHTGVWAEECARAEVSPYLNLQGIVLAGEAILRSGTDEQKTSLLPGTASGAILWCQLFSEPEAGSDLASLRTTAVGTPEEGFVVTGQKTWCSNGQLAEMGILMARTGGPGHRGISFFLLDMGLPGIEVRPLRQMTGDAEFTEVFLDSVEVPGDALLGPLDGGWGVAMGVLGDERGSSDASGLISLDRRLARLARLAESSGGGVERDRLASVLASGHALRSMLVASGGGPGAGSAAKLLRTELEFGAAGLAVDLSGPAGMLAGGPTDGFLYSPGMKIAGGSSEIQRNIIGERVLGLPREPKPDR